MKKLIFTVICITIATFTFAGMSYAWQGRMAGMGDPYGLVQDESDFLIHPSMLLDGTSIKFYGHYRYTYTDVMDWDYDWDDFNIPINTRWYRASGDEQEHNTLLGAAFPVGPGRMGAFFSYDGQRNDYNRDWKPNTTLPETEYDFEDQLDNFAVRILYGLPLNGFSIGGEVGFEYRDEKSENFRVWGTQGVGNNFTNFYGIYPYESDYWNAFLKGSIQGNIGNIPAAFTLRGGYILTGESELDYWVENPIGTTIYENDPEGDIKGYSIGGDLWLRFPICEGLTLPHLIRIDYQEKRRTGSGADSAGASSYYRADEKRINIEAGGGFDRKCSENDSRLAGGIYYNYIENNNDFYYKPGIFDEDIPHYSEHRVIARMIWEKPLSSNAELRTAMNWFYGNIEKEVRLEQIGIQEFTSTIKGPHWGVDVSLGCTIALNSFSIEPFINGGYQEYDLDGDIDIDTGAPDNGDADESREQWFIGGGFSLLFGN